MTEAGNTPRLFGEPDFRHMLSLEVQRCTRYQDFLSLCLVRASIPGVDAAQLEASIRRQIADMLRSTDFVGSIGPDTAVLLVHTPDSDAALITGRIRDRVVKVLAAQGEKPGPANLRLGSACFPVDGTTDDALVIVAKARLEE